MENEIRDRRNKQYELETNEMLEILHQNHNQFVSKNKIKKMLSLSENKLKMQQIEKNKKRKIIDIITLILFILLMTFVLAVFMYQFNKLCEKREEEFLKNCTRTNNQEYCEEILYD